METERSQLFDELGELSWLEAHRIASVRMGEPRLWIAFGVIGLVIGSRGLYWLCQQTDRTMFWTQVLAVFLGIGLGTASFGRYWWVRVFLKVAEAHERRIARLGGPSANEASTQA